MEAVDIVAGVVIAVLAGMGIGGGGLLVLYLVFIKNVSQLEAQGLNLVFFVFAALASLAYHIKRRKMNWRLTVFLGVTGTVGAYMGSVTARGVDPNIVRSVFGWVLIVSGVITFFVKGKKNGGEKGGEKKKKFFLKKG